MHPINKLPAERFMCPQHFRDALDRSTKQLILDYLREIHLYLSTKSTENQWSAICNILQMIHNIFELLPRGSLSADMQSLDFSIENRITDLPGFIDAIEANCGRGIGILYDFMPKFPHWAEANNTRFKYYQRETRDILSDFYYCGYVRDPRREDNIQKIIHSGRRYSFPRQIVMGTYDFLCEYGAFMLPLAGALLMLDYAQE